MCMAAICCESNGLDLDTFNNDQGQQTLTSVSSCTLTAAAAATLKANSRCQYNQLQNQSRQSLDAAGNVDENVTSFDLDRSAKMKPISKSAHVIDFFLCTDKTEDSLQSKTEFDSGE